MKKRRRLLWIIVLGVLLLASVLSCSSPDPSPRQPQAPPASEQVGTQPIKPTQPPTTPSLQPASAQTQAVSIHFIDVGQGDSVLITTDTGRNVLIDGGTRASGSTVVSYLKKQGIPSLDLVIATHPHEDHIGGLISVIQQIPVAKVIDSGATHTTKAFEDYLLAIKAKPNTIFELARKGQTYDLDGVKLQILWPATDPPDGGDLNEASVCVLLVHGDVRVLFTGDLPSTKENQVATRAQVLKVAHHGSRHSTSATFLATVKPEVAIICVGQNTYGHPHSEALQRLATIGATIYRTDTAGTIVLTVDGKSYQVDGKPWVGTIAEPAPAPAPTPAPAPAPVSPGKYVGSIKSDKYHYPTCSSAKNILEANQIWFVDEKAAQAKGYVPCGICKPPR